LIESSPFFLINLTYYSLDRKHRNITGNSDNSRQLAKTDEDDNVCIGTILQRSATARRPDKPATTNLVPHSKSMRLKKREELSLDNEELKLAMKQALSAIDTTMATTEPEVTISSSFCYIYSSTRRRCI
jgi:hypothetical protein